MLTIESLDINAEKTERIISNFIFNEVKKSGLKGVIVSVSGGIDSAVALALSVRALGSKKVRALTIPERDITLDSDICDVIHLTSSYDVTCDTIEITPMINVMQEILPLYNFDDKISSGNLKPRLRMIVAYHYANTLGYMVVGSSNKTELLTGYFTKYGDGGVDLLPLGDFYKCQVRQIAKYLGISKSIIEKKPSAGLWHGQTDEGELGASYDIIDLIIYGREIGMDENVIAEEINVDIKLVRKILLRVKISEHKRCFPLILRHSNVSG